MIDDYKLAQSIPNELKGNFPIIEELKPEFIELNEVEKDE